MGNLSAKRMRFCEEYMVDMNGKQAAIRAGYSEKTAEQQASQHLRILKVQEYLQTLRATQSQRTEVDADMVIAELRKVAFSDLRKALTAKGHLIDPQDWPDDLAGAVSSLEVVQIHKSGDDDEDAAIEYTHKIKVWDKISALEKIGKHLGMFVDRKEFRIQSTDDLKWSVEYIDPKLSIEDA